MGFRQRRVIQGPDFEIVDEGQPWDPPPWTVDHWHLGAFLDAQCCDHRGCHHERHEHREGKCLGGYKPGNCKCEGFEEPKEEDPDDIPF